MSFWLHSIKFLLLLTIFIGCSVKAPTAQENAQKIEKLTKMLLNTSRLIDKNEAKDLAKSSIYYAQELARKYEVVSPPLWQNTLVNLNFKKRGLCYQWSHDLGQFLIDKGYKTLTIHDIGADIGTYFEHNALAITAKGRDIREGIILDAWRNSGNLYFKKIEEDKKYKWKERFDLR